MSTIKQAITIEFPCTATELKRYAEKVIDVACDGDVEIEAVAAIGGPKGQEGKAVTIARHVVESVW